MKFKKICQISTIMLGVSTPLIATTLAVASCGKSTTTTIPIININPISWNDFKADVKEATALEIINVTQPIDWANQTNHKYLLGGFVFDDIKHMGTVTISNIRPASSATFSIIFNTGQTYDVKNWKYNNDMENTFALNGAFLQTADIVNVIAIPNADPNKKFSTVFIATHNTGLYTYQSNDPNKTIKLYSGANGPGKNVQINKMFKIYKSLYLTTSDGVYILKNGVFKTDLHMYPGHNVYTILYVNALYIIIDTDKGILSSVNSGEDFEVDTYIGKTINQWYYSPLGFTYIATDTGLWYSYYGSEKGLVETNINAKVGKAVNCVIKINDTIYVGTAGAGLWSATDHKTFSQITDGLPSYLNIQKIIKINDKIYVATDHGLYVSTSGQIFNFVKVISNVDYITNIIKVNNTIYVMTNNKGLFISLDDGATFEAKRITNFSNWDNHINNVINIPASNTIYITTNKNGLWNN